MWRGWIGALAVLGLACSGAPDATTAPCLRVLERRLPEARALAVRGEPARGRPVIAFEHGDWRGGRVRGSLACAIETTAEGRRRVARAELDGEPLTEAELAVVNAELFLADLGRAGRAAD